jgi:tRNA-dihydrouridine synthase
MVGRGALGNPWVFSPQGRPVTLVERLPVILRYLELAERYLQPDRVLFKIKNHTTKFLTGLTGAARIRQSIYLCKNTDEIAAQLCQQSDEEIVTVDN